jgi:ADP-heptose:LPS heptosyltransferase
MKILIVKIGGVGDVAMALRMLPAIDAQWPGAKVHWLCGRTTYPLLRHFDALTLHVVDESRILRGSTAEKIAGVLEAWRHVAFRRFDLILSGHADRRYSLLVALTFARERRGFLRAVAHRLMPVPGRYHGHEYERLVTGVDGPAFARPASIGFPLLSLDPRILLALDQKRPVIALSPSAPSVLPSRLLSLREWPVSYYRALAARLIELGYSVVVTGTAAEIDVPKIFGTLPIVDLVGKLNVDELVEVYRRCDCVVAHDSGPLHLASLAGIRGIGLFGPTPSSSFLDPKGQIVPLVSREGLKCSPCFDGKHLADCRENLCMTSISVDHVIEAVRRRLALVSAPRESEQRAGI